MTPASAGLTQSARNKTGPISVHANWDTRRIPMEFASIPMSVLVEPLVVIQMQFVVTRMAITRARVNPVSLGTAGLAQSLQPREIQRHRC